MCQGYDAMLLAAKIGWKAKASASDDHQVYPTPMSSLAYFSKDTIELCPGKGARNSAKTTKGLRATLKSGLSNYEARTIVNQ